MQFSSVIASVALSSIVIAQSTSTAVVQEDSTVSKTITSCSHEACTATTSKAIATETATETGPDDVVYATTTVDGTSSGASSGVSSIAPAGASSGVSSVAPAGTQSSSDDVTYVDETTTPTVTKSAVASTDVTTTPTLHTTFNSGNYSNGSRSSIAAVSSYEGGANLIKGGVLGGVLAAGVALLL